MRNCDHCQNVVEKDGLFCSACGTSLHKEAYPGKKEKQEETPGGKTPVSKNARILRLVTGAFIIGTIAVVLLNLLAAPGSEENVAPGNDDETTIQDQDIVYAEPTNYISSLEAEVTSLKFFESAYDQPRFKEYDTSFTRNEARYINWEIQTVHPPANEDREVVITQIYYRSSGVIEHIGKAIFTFPAGWTETWQAWGYGYDEPGRWRTGTYYVEVLIDNVVVAAGSFDIY